VEAGRGRGAPREVGEARRKGRTSRGGGSFAAVNARPQLEKEDAACVADVRERVKERSEEGGGKERDPAKDSGKGESGSTKGAFAKHGGKEEGQLCRGAATNGKGDTIFGKRQRTRANLRKRGFMQQRESAKY